MQTTPVTSESRKDEAARLLSERLCEHYGERLFKAFHIPDNPYEAQSFAPGVYVVAVLEGEVVLFKEIDDLHRITDALNAEGGYEVIATAYAISKEAYDGEAGCAARSVRREGRAL